MRLPSAVSTLLGFGATGIVALLWAAMPAHPSAVNLAADLPGGALMTVESPDFETLLESWIHSPE